MPTSAFRQSYYLDYEVRKVMVNSAESIRLLRDAELERETSKALVRTNDATQSNQQIEAQINTLLELGIQLGRDRRTTEGRELTSRLHKKLAHLLGQLSNISAVDQLAPELNSCKEELEAVKIQHENCKKALREAVDKCHKQQKSYNVAVEEARVSKAAWDEVSADLSNRTNELRRAEGAYEAINTDFSNVAAQLQEVKSKLATCEEKAQGLEKAKEDAETGQQQARSERTRVNLELSQTHNKLKQMTTELRQKKSELEQAELDNEQLETVSAQDKSAIARAEEEQKQSNLVLQQTQAELQLAIDQQHEADRRTQAAEEARKQSEATLAKERLQAQEERQNAEKDREQSESNRLQTEEERRHVDAQLAKLSHERQRGIGERQALEEERRTFEEERRTMDEERRTVEEERRRVEEARRTMGEERRTMGEERRTMEEGRQYAEEEHSRAKAERRRAEAKQNEAVEKCRQAQAQCDQAHTQNMQMAHDLEIAQNKTADYDQTILHAAEEFQSTSLQGRNSTTATLSWLIECLRNEMIFRSKVVPYLFSTRRKIALSHKVCCDDHDFSNEALFPLEALAASSPAFLRPLETKDLALSAATTFNNVVSAAIETRSESYRSITAVRDWLQQSHSRFAPETASCLLSLCSSIHHHIVSMQDSKCQLQSKLTTHELTIRVLGLTLKQQQQEAEHRLTTARDQLAATFMRLLEMNDKLTAVEAEETRLTHVLFAEKVSKTRYRIRLLQEKRFLALQKMREENLEEIREMESKRKADSALGGGVTQRPRLNA